VIQPLISIRFSSNGGCIYALKSHLPSWFIYKVDVGVGDLCINPATIRRRSNGCEWLIARLRQTSKHVIHLVTGWRQANKQVGLVCSILQPLIPIKTTKEKKVMNLLELSGFRNPGRVWGGGGGRLYSIGRISLLSESNRYYSHFLKLLFHHKIEVALLNSLHLRVMAFCVLEN
jgi:hypothetical protein